jgi:glycosyltransferase involved in cell wall biosynthesis
MYEPSISVVLPVRNEERNLPELLGEIRTVFDAEIDKTYEIIIVDDASSDRSVEAADRTGDALRIGSPLLVNVQIIREPEPTGQFHALLDGMRAARGRLIVTMDADLQHDPADIPRLLEKMGEYDLICGIRAARHDGVARRFCSRVANSFRNLITGDTTTDSGCMFRVMRRECLPALLPWDRRLFGCEGLFFPLLARRKGFHAIETMISHRDRKHGKSRYHLIRGRFWRGLAACIRVALTE